jgi:hypothetical protein
MFICQMLLDAIAQKGLGLIHHKHAQGCASQST